MRRSVYALLALLLVVGIAIPALAGQLFPPENAPGGAGACTNGQVLHWTGNSLVCKDPTPGVSLDCPNGQVLASVIKGVPNCVVPSTTPLNLSCPSGQVLLGVSNGTAVCGAVQSINLSCPAGSVLTAIKDGVPVCATPTAPAVTASCPAGQILQSVNNGTPVCIAGSSLAASGAMCGLFSKITIGCTQERCSYSNPAINIPCNGLPAKTCPAGYSLQTLLSSGSFVMGNMESATVTLQSCMKN